MKIAIAVLAFCFMSFVVDAQKVIDPEVRFLSWIYLKDNPQPLKGVILETNDSTIQFISSAFLVKNKAVSPYTSETIPVSGIDKIKFRKKGSVGRGMIVGALGGVMAGAITGFIEGDDVCEPGSWCIFQFSAGDKAVIYGTLLAVPGTALGAILGSSRNTVYINGGQSLYFNSRNELKAYALIRE
jgi:hypothetical protein